MNNEVWLIGSGPMAIDYAKVLEGLQVPFIVIGRGNESAKEFKSKTGIDVITGGLNKYLDSNPLIVHHAIVSTGAESLSENTISLLNYGIKNILCEKPGGISLEHVKSVSELAESKRASVLLAYNRRFYSSVLAAKEIIKQDGGVTSFNFEFTEWSHIIGNLNKPSEVLSNWFLVGSTHVTDLAFYLGGKPVEINSFTNKKLDWHSRSAIFAGAGITDNGALFSYNANWDAPGRYAVEILTKSHRIYFKPLEKLQIQKKATVKVEFVEIDDNIDQLYKPGLFLQCKSFLENNYENFIDIHQQLNLFPIYLKMANY